ncbi:hypothetical protein LJR234_000374 [Mesorhizobium amorphae]|uniref:hypothetical protein n=1 Tax=Mesorhizobium amorphae TaxID=71433 RepID=UPI003ECF2B2B
MADKELPDIPAATTPLVGSETVYIVQGGNSREAVASDIAALANAYTDAAVATAAAGVAKRGTVRVKTTANITISTALNAGDVIDGVTLALGDPVLVGIQSAPAENGVYIAGPVPARSAQFDTYDEHPGAIIVVEEGTAGADTFWYCTSNVGGTLNTTAITFASVNIAAAVLASTTEVLTGTDAAKSVTPDAAAALWEKGADVASASTISLGEGGFFHITGTTGITDIDFATPKDGRQAWLEFDGVLPITHHATTLVCIGGVNITTEAGDRALVVQDNGDNIHMLAYVRKSGKPLIPSVVGTPFELEVACSDQSTAITAGNGKTDFFAPMDATITEVFIAIGTVSSSGAVTFDLNKAGATMFSTNPSIVAGERTNLTGGGTAGVLSTTTWAKGDYFTVDFDAAGTGAKAAKMIIRGTRL